MFKDRASRDSGRGVEQLPVTPPPKSPPKWMVYGSTAFINVQVDDPFEFHRGWPGVGPLHSPAYGVVLAVIALGLFRSPQWALGLMIGQWAHAFSDTMDSNGVMLLFPFSETRTAIGAWTYAAEAGRRLDTAAYFSSPGAAWDAFWISMTFVRWKVLTADYFRQSVMPADPVWGWLERYFPPAALLVLYRAALFYGLGRFIAWMMWAHVLNDFKLDLSWGGPDWIKGVH